MLPQTIIQPPIPGCTDFAVGPAPAANGYRTAAAVAPRTLLTFILLFFLATDSEAGRSFSSGGRSFSSGRSSFSSSRSFSSGRSSYSSSRSFSSGSSSSGRSFSSGSSRTSSSRTSSSPTSTSSSWSGHSYSSSSRAPGKNSFDGLGVKQQMRVESRVLYSRGQTPRTEYRTSSGRTATIDPKDARIERLRGQLDQQKWVNREMRQQQFYGGYWSRPAVVFHDPYPSFFWWWLLDRSLNERAMWAYCHKSDMDSARYQALLAKDAKLEAKIKELERSGVKMDKTYVPAGMDADLMYSNDYVDAVYNPQGKGWSTFWKVIFWIAIICGIMWLIWFVFIRKT